MKLEDIFEKREYKNPFPNVISSKDQLFGDAFDEMDDHVYAYIEMIPELKDQYKNASTRGAADIVMQVRNKLSPETTLPIDKLISSEPTLDKAHIDAIMNKTFVKGKIPYVIKYDNKYIVVDGNHRVVASFLSGEKNIRVKLMDLDTDMS